MSDFESVDEWEENYNYYNWNKDLNNFNELPNMIETYSGGSVGGYVLKDNQLYSWHTEKVRGRVFLLQDGYILIRKIIGCPENCYYYEVKLVDKIPENLDAGIIVWK